jgi:hypothetical protein
MFCCCEHKNFSFLHKYSEENVIGFSITLSNLEEGVRRTTCIIRKAFWVHVLSAQDAGIPTLLQFVNVALRCYSITGIIY